MRERMGCGIVGEKEWLQAGSICIIPVLLLRSLRACSLGVVLAKVARCLYICCQPATTLFLQFTLLMK